MRLTPASLLLAAGLAGCQATGDVEPPSPSSIAARVVAARERMHARYVAARSIQLSIAVGDLDRARSTAKLLAVQEEPDFLPEWKPYLDSIRNAASQIAQSGDTIAAAKTMAQLGRACARCHEATDAKIAWPAEPAPEETARLASQMASHQWAAARMWEGLIAPNDERWQAGAHTLAGARMTITAESGELGIADDAARARAQAERGTKLGDQDARATLYGDMLATCAHCHATIRDRALPPAVVDQRR